MSIPELIANGSRSTDSILLEELNKHEARIIELEQQKAELVEACKTAKWIQDRLIEHYKWGSGLVEWQIIHAAIDNVEAKP